MAHLEGCFCLDSYMNKNMWQKSSGGCKPGQTTNKPLTANMNFKRDISQKAINCFARKEHQISKKFQLKKDILYVRIKQILILGFQI